MFSFKTFDNLTDGEIQLILMEHSQADDTKGYVPAYIFGIVTPSNMTNIMGKVVLRVGNNENTFYGGHIGYKVEKKFRGYNFASKACLLIREVALAHDMKKLLITCNPDNIPSRKTCEKIDAQLREIVDLPPNHDLYERGERQCCIYEWELI
ncbi:GNAT family N-acetyltransferase [Bacillus paramycoides]|uniref:GNAT family N-acetyltransferase n=1 Tax=Bacillus paramycoides TaxID=2026194 RepID=UPI002E1C4BAE|nr:GNAT family N-acetyltransferase [Bacillus paramycoides]MED0963843.1 GNAT family N-acetyltransferase [Bacillus paramycoides]